MSPIYPLKKININFVNLVISMVYRVFYSVTFLLSLNFFILSLAISLVCSSFIFLAHEGQYLTLPLLIINYLHIPKTSVTL